MKCKVCGCKEVESGQFYPACSGEIGSEHELEEMPNGYDCPDCGEFVCEE